MSISVTLSGSPSQPAHGATVTATYSVTGNAPSGSTLATIDGTVHIGDTDYHASAEVTLPGTPALPESFSVPTCPGLTFVATSNPRVFTAVVP